MASGAPRPGGYRAPAPGGRRAVAAGGTNMNDEQLREHYNGYPDFDLDGPGAGAVVSGPRVAVTRSVTNIRRGRASAGSAPTYLWTLPTLPGGSTATVSNGTTATASFTPTNAGTHVFRCTVTYSDGTAIAKDFTYISA